MDNYIQDIEKLKNISGSKRMEAIRRVRVVRKFERFADEYVRGGGKRTDAAKIFAVENDVAEGTLRRWAGRYKKTGPVGLVDNRGGIAARRRQARRHWSISRGFISTRAGDRLKTA